MADPSTGEYLRPRIDDYPDGVYRVVGTGDPVALLRVGEADGTRSHTGELIHAERPLDGFEPADPPEPDRSVAARLAGTAETGYWSLRAFRRGLLDRPGASAVAGAILVVGLAGDGLLPLGATASGLCIVAGSLGLAAVAGGWLP